MTGLSPRASSPTTFRHGPLLTVAILTQYCDTCKPTLGHLLEGSRARGASEVLSRASDAKPNCKVPTLPGLRFIGWYRAVCNPPWPPPFYRVVCGDL
ncbi:hypothetical protein CTAM01_14253 [Colletotrichum tamarilloi]|uniref:Uncharacterized protein n=1 Tax=Colletotrichum tamarilloi TaxID=1209934 RepID=A0ABQ9QPW1_9PEZI|nr:uncharacterized protein CTAM01_14253 [Colletotrichum tamarilloi]KAK1480691.1 hypothetical protein CTAM01_14253 [Colletotrichum tamarilloi]